MLPQKAGGGYFVASAEYGANLEDFLMPMITGTKRGHF